MSKFMLVLADIHTGGAERVMITLANHWVEQGHEVHLAVYSAMDRKKNYEIHPAVVLHHLGFIVNDRNKIRRIFFGLRTLYRLNRLIKSVAPEFLLSFLFNSHNVIAALGTKTPVFISDRGSPYRPLNFWTKMLFSPYFPKFRGMIFQTDEAKDFFHPKLQSKRQVPATQVIVNPIRKIESSPNKKREKVIVNVGRLCEDKNQKGLVHVFSLLEDTSWKLKIFGEGPLRDSLEQQVHSLGLQDRVELPGITMKIDDVLTTASIFAFSSLFEGLPNALCEGMAAGLPCVSFDCDIGPRTVISHEENGFLVPMNNTEVFRNTLQRLQQDENLRERIGRKAAEIQKDRSVEIIANHYLEFIQKNL